MRTDEEINEKVNSLKEEKKVYDSIDRHDNLINLLHSRQGANILFEEHGFSDILSN